MTPESNKDKFTRVYFFLWGLCLLVAVIAFVFYQFGFRLSNRFAPVKISSVELTSNESGLRIFLDNREKTVTAVEGTYFLQNVIPGLHSIIVSKEGFWPWTKTVAVNENAARPLFVFVFPIDGVKIEPVSSSAPETTAALKQISRGIPEPIVGARPFDGTESFTLWLKHNVPDRKISADKSTALFVEDNTIYLGWVSETEPPPHYYCEENPCKMKLPVTVSTMTIKSVDFYKDRRDVALFAAGPAIYAIEADREGTQNFEPVYKGRDPYFYETSDGTLYIKDGNSIVRGNL